MFCKSAVAAALAGLAVVAVAAPSPVISPNFGMAQYDVVRREGKVALDGKVDEAVLAAEQWQDESTVDGEDRVELFFAGAPVDRPGENGMERYYAIEVDAKGRVHDYAIAYYRQFDSDWALTGLESKAVLTGDGYSVEGKIPLKVLQDLHLLRDGLMRTGVFRAEFSPSGGTEPRAEWISWVNPNTPQPDFHVDSAFGVFRFLP